MNWDAAIDKSTNVIGVGLIARDSTGKVKASMCSHMAYITEPSMAEVFVVMKGVEFAKNMGFQRLLLKGDLQVIVLALNSDGPCSVSLASLVEDSRIILQTFSS